MSGFTFDMLAAYLVREAWNSLRTPESTLARIDLYDSPEITETILWNRLRAFSYGAIVPFDVPDWSRELLAKLAFARCMADRFLFSPLPQREGWRDHEIFLLRTLMDKNRSNAN